MANIRKVEFVFVGNKSHLPDSDEADKVVQIVHTQMDFADLSMSVDNNLSCYLWNKYCLPTSPKYRFDLLCLDRDEVISFIESHRDALPPAIADDYMRWQDPARSRIGIAWYRGNAKARVHCELGLFVFLWGWLSAGLTADLYADRHGGLSLRVNTPIARTIVWRGFWSPSGASGYSR